MVKLDDLKTPPHNFEAEKSILSCLLIDNEVIYTVEWLRLQADDFYEPAHKHIFKAISLAWAKRQLIDTVTVGEELEKAGHLEEIGGASYLYDVASYAITATVAKEYAKIVKEKSILRVLQHALQEMLQETYVSWDPEPILEKIQKQIMGVVGGMQLGDTRHIKLVLDEVMETYDQLITNPDAVHEQKVQSHFEELDQLIGGFAPGQLIIIASRPSMGKTSLATNIARQVASQWQKRVAFYSIEMSDQSIVNRLLSLVAEVPMHHMTQWTLNKLEFEAIGQARLQLQEVDLFIDHSVATPADLGAKMRKLKIEQGKLDLVVVDYLQLMDVGDRHSGANRVQEISTISRRLKELAKELEVPVIALSQLSRGVENRPDKRPVLADLRESWAIEQDADCVMMLYREDYYDEYTDKKWVTSIYVRKNRNGPTGDIDLNWEATTMRFTDRSGAVY